MQKDILYMLIKDYMRSQGGDQFKEWLACFKGFDECAESLLEGAILELSKRLHYGGEIDGFTANLLADYFNSDSVSLLGFLFQKKRYDPVESESKRRSILDELKRLAANSAADGPVGPVAQACNLSSTPALS